MPTFSEGVHDAASLGKVQDQMREWIRRIEEIRASMTEEKIAKLTIQHEAELRRAIDKVPKFLESGQAAIRAHLFDRGAFEAGAEKVTKKRAARK